MHRFDLISEYGSVFVPTLSPRRARRSRKSGRRMARLALAVLLAVALPLVLF